MFAIAEEVDEQDPMQCISKFVEISCRQKSPVESFMRSCRLLLPAQELTYSELCVPGFVASEGRDKPERQRFVRRLFKTGGGWP